MFGLENSENDMDKRLFQQVAGGDSGTELHRESSPVQWAPAAVLGSFGGRLAPRFGAGWLLLLGLATAASGQEAVRMSMAGAAAAAAQRRAASTLGYYNLKLGPTAWNFGAGLGMEYNSNVNYTQDDPQGDFLFRPQINAGMLWPLTDQNSLNLTLGAGYWLYASHTELNRLFLTPDSGLSFDVYVKDFRINFHDRFSITEYSYQDPTLAGTGDYSLLENALGTWVLWDLNQALLRFGYDHVDYVSLGSDTSRPDGVSEVASLSAGYAPKPGMVTGLEMGGGLLSYSGENTFYDDATQWNVGGFYDAQLSQYLHLAAHVGYTVYAPDANQQTTLDTEFSGMYAELDLNHRINEYVSYTLSGGRTVNLAYYGGTVEEYFARLSAGWNIFYKITLTTSLSYEYGTQLSGFAETFDRYGIGIRLGRYITSKLSASLGYQFYLRQSDLPNRDYDLNIASLNLNYRF